MGKNEKYQNSWEVSSALAFPAIGSTRPSRVLQFALEEAIRITGFGSLSHGAVDSLSLFFEPEAAAIFLATNDGEMLVSIEIIWLINPYR